MIKLELGAVALMVAAGLSVSACAAADSIAGPPPVTAGPGRPIVPAAALQAPPPTRPPIHRIVRTSSRQVPPPTASPGALHGHGEVAIVTGHRLYLTGGRAGRLRRVRLAGWAAMPAWSPDGRWLAVGVSAPPPAHNPYATEPVALWLVDRRGHVVRRLTAGGVNVAAAHWSPVADTLLVVGHARGKDRAFTVSVAGSATSIAASREIAGAAWSPDGTQVAVSVGTFGHQHWAGELETVPAAGGHAHVVTRSRGNVLGLAGWLPDGRGLLGWLDFQGSGSLAADGLPFFSVPVAGGHHRRTLTRTMLQYPAWLSTSPTSGDIAFVGGGDRELTEQHKHLEICGAGGCRRLAQPRRAVTFDPAYSPSGRLVVVRDRVVSPGHTDGFGNRYVNAVNGSGTIKQVVDGQVRPLPGVGQGAFSPVWGRDGSLLFLRHRSVWLLPPTGGPAHRVIGPVSLPANYYGYVPWLEAIAWSDAPVGR